MKRIFTIIIFIVAVVVAISIGYFSLKEKVNPVTLQSKANEAKSTTKLVDFSNINQNFLFSANIPNEFELEYMPNVRAINIYDPMADGANNIEKSQIYVSFFKASRFLTLSTVDITQQDKIIIQGREAVLYEITKKETVPNFVGQPTWRNSKHKAIDIRYSKDSPSYFYSFAQNPNISQKVFDDFINSLIFIRK